MIVLIILIVLIIILVYLIIIDIINLIANMLNMISDRFINFMLLTIVQLLIMRYFQIRSCFMINLLLTM